MTRIVFWNVNNRDLTDAVCALAVSTAADVLILNENTVPSSATLHALQRSVSADFYYPTFISEKRFHCFCRNASLDVSEIHEGFRTSVRKFRLGHQRILLVLVHGLDVRNYDSNKRLLFTAKLADEIKFIKEDKKNNKLVLLGDFNMNPYDDGMNEAEGLNAMMTKACAEKRTRGISQKITIYITILCGVFLVTIQRGQPERYITPKVVKVRMVGVYSIRLSCITRLSPFFKMWRSSPKQEIIP